MENNSTDKPKSILNDVLSKLDSGKERDFDTHLDLIKNEFKLLCDKECYCKQCVRFLPEYNVHFEDKKPINESKADTIIDCFNNFLKKTISTTLSKHFHLSTSNTRYKLKPEYETVFKNLSKVVPPEIVDLVLNRYKKDKEIVDEMFTIDVEEKID